jgi:NADPH-dependent 2,4-dienoyl-CoA reductase/sulfur reductase-like enzyme
VIKVFDLAIACTGLDDTEAAAAGFRPVTVEKAALDHARYYPGAEELRVRVTGDSDSGRLLGAQIIGDYRGEVAKRIDVFAAAIFNRMTVDGLSDLDLSYTPPFGTPWDAVQLGGQEWTQRTREALRAGPAPKVETAQ